MEKTPDAIYVQYVLGLKQLKFRRSSDGSLAHTADLGHALYTGKSMRDMIVTTGTQPSSAIFINDRRHPEQQQLVAFQADDPPYFVDISVKHVVALMTEKGMLFVLGFLV